MNGNRLLVLFFCAVMILDSLAFPGAAAAAVGDNCLPDICFGGTIIKKDRKWCLIKVSFPPFVIPNPVGPYFYLTHVLQPGDAIHTLPMLHKFYDVPLLSREKIRNSPKKGVQVLGGYIPGGSEAFRQSCTVNKEFLPKAPLDSFGLLDFWGTGCQVTRGEVVPLPQSKCKKIKR